MYRFASFIGLFALLIVLFVPHTAAQTFPTDDPVVREMWTVGMEQSQTEEMAHMLMDVTGPRLAGSPGLVAAQDWLMELYESWGVTVHKEEYGTWRGWQQGLLHVDMLAPRRTSLEGYLMAYSPGTDGPVEGEVITPPTDLTDENRDAWLASIRGKYILVSAPEPMCRAPQELEANALPETVERLDSLRGATQQEWARRLQSIASARERTMVLEEAGVAGILTSRWSGGWGANKVFSTRNQRAVAVDISCEDYSMLARLAESGHTPTIRINAEAEDLGVVPQFNVIAEMRGSELPDEYVLLGAHLDSWHSATGATDNGTGTITMLEAARILKETYPNPRRTILIGHWGAEEMGLIGSGAFREDHPEVMEGMQAAFNQDNGTWRFEKLEGQGYLASAEHLPKWMAVVPTELSSGILLEVPGPQNNRGSDHSSFVCAGVPSFRLQSPYDEYRQYTWHTNIDTYDKIVFDDLKANATVAAMLAYMASEDPVFMDRTKANLPNGRSWPSTCRQPMRAPR